jgi:predicted SPOUT superfamily RNA methylase MTH1
MTKTKLAIAIPASAVSDTPHLREKTSKIGLIGRAAAIFRVGEIIVYPDNAKMDQHKDMQFIALLLRYMETPQYLRKILFKIQPDLEYAGILPPLRTPHHPVSGKTKHLKIGEYREGVVLTETKEGLIVEIGVQQPALLRQRQFAVGDRLTAQVVSVGEPVEVQAVNREEVPLYWGYRVTMEDRAFGELVAQSGFDLKIATARVGDDFMAVASRICDKMSASKRVLVAFGAPTRGLHEIVADEGLTLEEVADFVVNTVPFQGTVTVRLEEALLASLAVLNIHCRY